MRQWQQHGDPVANHHGLNITIAGAQWRVDPGDPKPPARYCVMAWMGGNQVIKSAGNTIAAALMVAVSLVDQEATVMAVVDRDTGEIIHQTLTPDHLPGYCVSFRDALRDQGSRPWRSSAKDE